MNYSVYDIKRQELEKIFQQQSQPRAKEQTFGSKIRSLFQQVLFSLAKQPEPRIGVIQDYFGKTVWCVYDPITGQSARLSSEREVRIWLEERYYSYNAKQLFY